MSTAPNGWQNPKTNWASADVPAPSDFNRIEGNINSIETGSRSIDQAQVPTGNSGTLRQLLDWFANRIKAILGTTNWYDAPPTTLSAAKTHIDRTDNPHGVTAAQVSAAPDSHVGSGGSAHAVATTSQAGFMSSSDKSKLDGIAAGATKGARLLVGTRYLGNGVKYTVTHNFGNTVAVSLSIEYTGYYGGTTAGHKYRILNSNQIELYNNSGGSATFRYEIIG